MNGFQDLVAAARASALVEREFFDVIDGVNIYVADGYCNIFMQGAKVPAAFADREADGSKVVYINSITAKQVDTDLRQAIVLHECGHIACGHIDRCGDELIIDVDLELEADAYAVAHGAKASVLKDTINAIRQMQIDAVGVEAYEAILRVDEGARAVDDMYLTRMAALNLAA